LCRINIFCEDIAHEEFTKSLLNRFSKKYDKNVKYRFFRSTGGYGRVISDLTDYVSDLRSGTLHIPDLIIVARDANCKGLSETKSEINSVLEEYSEFSSLAIPDPHIERWLLLDSSAFKSALGSGRDAPDYKCEKARYKELLADAVKDAGVTPQIGGLEHTEEIVHAMDLEKMRTEDDSLGSFIQSVDHFFRDV
jgi:hypothetical protein